MEKEFQKYEEKKKRISSETFQAGVRSVEQELTKRDEQIDRPEGTN